MDVTASLIKNGDRQAFEELFHSYYSSLCLFALRYLKDADEAEEVVQDTFVKFWNKRENISIDISLKSYLYTSVRNHCLNKIKHEAVKREHVSVVLSDGTEGVDHDHLVTNELADRIADAIERMPTERRRIFRMSRDEGLRYKEIAEYLNISVKTVENQMGKALQYLRTELADFLVIAWMIYFILNEWV